MKPPEIPLDRPLSADLLGSVGGGLAAYARYPVFSVPWLWRRTAAFGGVFAVVSTIVGLGLRFTGEPSTKAVAVGLHFLFGGVVLASFGPSLATLVRHRRLAAEREPSAVLAAMAAGTVGAFGVDQWVSGRLERHLDAPHADAPSSAVASLLVALLFYGGLGGWLSVGRYFRERRRSVELARAEQDARLRQLEARLALLQSRVEPHFLFNALASVGTLIETDPVRARAAIDALARYLRATIPRIRDEGTRVDSTLGAQLEICSSYLELMRARMGDRLSWQIDVSEASRGEPFPALLLVTLVENAIRHGIEPKPGPGAIRIAAEAIPGQLVVTVVDDGVGLAEGFGAGVGLAHVQETLRARYGDAASFALSADGRTTSARIAVPS